MCTYRDLLAEMKVAVDLLVETAEQVKHERDNSLFTDCDYLSDEETYISESKELTKCVRKTFSSALKALIEHGASQVPHPPFLLHIGIRLCFYNILCYAIACDSFLL